MQGENILTIHGPVLSNTGNPFRWSYKAAYQATELTKKELEPIQFNQTSHK